MIAKIVDRNTIHISDLEQFDIDAIVHSGQVFRYFQTDTGWRIISGTNYADISVCCDHAKIYTNDAEYFFNYFDFTRDYAAVTASFARHAFLEQMLKSGTGLRILRGELTETVVSFILSANNNIKRFTKTLNSLCEKNGERLVCGEFGFPSLERLCKLTESDFKELGCGYRSAYLVKATKQLSDPEFDFTSMSQLSDELLYKKLRELSGVGDKVARCIMLFCFNRLSIAPVDTWMEKACQKIFGLQETQKMDAKMMAKKFEELFGQYAGVAQQYIFYHMQYRKKNFD